MTSFIKDEIRRSVKVEILSGYSSLHLITLGALVDHVFSGQPKVIQKILTPKLRIDLILIPYYCFVVKI